MIRAVLIGGALLGIAVPHSRASADKPALDEVSARSWRSLSSGRITPDGRYLVYSTGLASNPDEESELVIQPLGWGRERRLPLSQGVNAAASVPIDPTGRWVGFLHRLPGGVGVSLIELATGRRIDRRDVSAFEFMPGTNTRLLVKTGTSVRIASPEDPAGTEVATNVTTYSLSPDGRTLVWFDHAGVHAKELATGNDRSFGLLDGRAGPPIAWRKDGQGFFFLVQRAVSEAEAGAPPSAPIVWRSSDDYLAGERHGPQADWHYASMLNGTVTRIENDRLRIAGDAPASRILLAADIEAYGRINAKKAQFSASPHLADYYTVDSDTGERRLILRGVRVISRLAVAAKPILSPEGNKFLYQNADGDYVSRDLATGTERNLTAGLGPTFRMEGNDPPSGWQVLKNGAEGAPQVWNGWSADGRYALIADPYNVWALPVQSGKPINLTGDSRKPRRSCRLASFAAAIGPVAGPEPDLGKPLWFYCNNPETGNNMLLRRDPASGSLNELTDDAADFTYLKASRAPVHVMLRSSSIDDSDFFTVGRDWHRGRRLSDINPQQRRFLWGPAARLLNYRNARGESRRAIVYLPPGYREGQRYPAIFRIYEAVSLSDLHSYHAVWSVTDPTELMRRAGYAVVYADIRPRLGEPGEAALDDAEAALRATVAAGLVDERRAGLLGHSFGGYEALYIATKSRAFAAIVSLAGVADIVSNCGELYYRGVPKTTMCEFDQPYTGALWTERPDIFERNSPILHVRDVEVPVLLSHGTADQAVAASQSVAMFNALRHLNKPAALLQYPGEDHVYREPAARDFLQRMLEFYDHFLKGAPAPAWWSGTEIRAVEAGKGGQRVSN